MSACPTKGEKPDGPHQAGLGRTLQPRGTKANNEKGEKDKVSQLSCKQHPKDQSSAQHHVLSSSRCLHGAFPTSLSEEAPSATVAAGNAREVKAPGGDGHSLRAEDAANSSGGGGAHNGVLWEGAEDGAGQGHHHGRGLDDDSGVLALPDTGLIAAVGQRGRAAGLAGLALVVAGHVLDAGGAPGREGREEAEHKRG